MTDNAEKMRALGMAEGITEEAKHILFERYANLEDMRLDDERGQKARECASIYLLGVIAQALLSKSE